MQKKPFNLLLEGQKLSLENSGADVFFCHIEVLSHELDQLSLAVLFLLVLFLLVLLLYKLLGFIDRLELHF